VAGTCSPSPSWGHSVPAPLQVAPESSPGTARVLVLNGKMRTTKITKAHTKNQRVGRIEALTLEMNGILPANHWIFVLFRAFRAICSPFSGDCIFLREVLCELPISAFRSNHSKEILMRLPGSLAKFPLAYRNPEARKPAHDTFFHRTHHQNLRRPPRRDVRLDAVPGLRNAGLRSCHFQAT
jgi:hypothetical protein